MAPASLPAYRQSLMSKVGGAAQDSPIEARELFEDTSATATSATAVAAEASSLPLKSTAAVPPHALNSASSPKPGPLDDIQGALACLKAAAAKQAEEYARVHGSKSPYRDERPVQQTDHDALGENIGAYSSPANAPARTSGKEKDPRVEDVLSEDESTM